jgi:hypothetical protein
LASSPAPFDRWYEIIGNPIIADAILDRLVHNAYRTELSGESLRKNKSHEMMNPRFWVIRGDPGADGAAIGRGKRRS